MVKSSNTSSAPLIWVDPGQSSAGDVAAVFITHFHSDHIDTLGEMATLRWAAGSNPSPLPVYGPTGVETVVDGFNKAYSHDFVYRHEHHGDLVSPDRSAGMMHFPLIPTDANLTRVFEVQVV